MLFDLRGRGRRRTVQVVYLGLALLLGVGLVGFGIGGIGGGGGGLVNAVTNNGSSSASYSSQIKRDQQLTARQPNNAAAWATLIQDLFRQAGTGQYYDNVTNGGQFTAKAQPLLTQMSVAWQRYLTLTPHPSTDVANFMTQVYGGPGGLASPAAEIAPLEILIAAQPQSLTLYERLAVVAYQAKNTRQGDLAAAQVLALTPAAQRPALRQQLASLKANPTGTAGAPSAGGAPSSSTFTPVPNAAPSSAAPTPAAHKAPAKKKP